MLREKRFGFHTPSIPSFRGARCNVCYEGGILSVPCGASDEVCSVICVWVAVSVPP